MTLVKWDPFKDVSSLQDRINRMFEDFFPRSEGPGQAPEEYDWQPAADIFETDAGLIIQVELAGVVKEDVSVALKNNVLTLQGQRKPDLEIDARLYIHKERSFGTFQRSFTLKETVSPEKITARFKDGILTVEIPRMEAPPAKTIKVEIA